MLLIDAASGLHSALTVPPPRAADPYISKRLLTDDSPRLRSALQYMVYGPSQTFDVDRLIDLLQALEKFVAVRDTGDGSAFKVDGVRGGVDVGAAGDMKGTKALVVEPSGSGLAAPPPPPLGPPLFLADAGNAQRLTAEGEAAETAAKAREALTFFFSDDGEVFRGFLLDEVVRAADALSREALAELALTPAAEALSRFPAPPGSRALIRALSPPLAPADQKVIASIRKLTDFFLGNLDLSGADAAATARSNNPAVLRGIAPDPAAVRQAQALLPVLRDNQLEMSRFGLQIVSRLTELQATRALGYVRKQVAAI